MKTFTVRVYDDHYLVTDDVIGVGTRAVERGDLEAALSDEGVNKTAAPKKPRRKRGPNKTKPPTWNALEKTATNPAS